MRFFPRHHSDRLVLLLLGGIFAAGAANSVAAAAESGTYLGDGVVGRAITGLGFAPDVVIVKGPNARYGCCRTSTMTGDASKPLGVATAFVTNRIQSLTSDGFTLGNDADVNSAGVNYYWIAFKSAAGILTVGSYAGNAADNRDISTVGFQPDYVVVLGNRARHAVQRSSAMPGQNSIAFNAAGAVNKIQALIALGFQVGTDDDVNRNLIAYHYAAWKATPLEVSVGSYVGNFTDNRDIAGLGYRPEYVIIKAWSATAGAHRSASLGTADTLRFNNTNGLLADAIQALEVDGFEVGTDATANSAGITYYWTAFGARGPRIMKWEEVP